jgi:predicted outer membrane repeat protein
MFNKKFIKTMGSCLLLLILCFGIISCTHAADLGNNTDTKKNTNITIGPKSPGGLKQAVKIAENNATIYLKKGVYIGKNNRGITINKDINIEGLGSKVTINAQGKNRIFKITDGNVSIKKLRLLNGYTKNAGGAIYSTNGSLKVSNCIFTNNQAWSGGAIDDENSTINNCTFTKNKADYCGAIQSWFSTINNCTFTNNQAKFNGGAIDDENSTITNCKFMNNKATLDGGAIYSEFSTINKCTFQKNQAKNGGAIYDIRNSTITNCKFMNNKATLDGGAIYEKGKIYMYDIDLEDGDLTFEKVISNFKVSNSTFTKNQAKRNGGAFYSDGNSFHEKYTFVEKCTFEKNKATKKGGAVYNQAKTLKISNSKFTNNIAGKTYNAIYSKVTITQENVTITPRMY